MKPIKDDFIHRVTTLLTGKTQVKLNSLQPPKIIIFGTCGVQQLLAVDKGIALTKDDFTYRATTLLTVEIKAYTAYEVNALFTVSVTSQINNIFILSIKEEELGEIILNTIPCACLKKIKN